MFDIIIYTFIEEDKELADHTDIDWLDTALAIANIITTHILQEVQGYRRLAEFGNAAVLKTDDT